MQKRLRILRNKFYFLKNIKEVRESENLIFYQCLKCNAEIIGHKRTGKCTLVCSCGHSVKVYTGKNKHFKRGKIRYTENIADVKAKMDKDKKNRWKEESEKERIKRAENFKNYLNSDLKFLYNIVSYKRDITKQVSFYQCDSLLNGVEYKEGYKRVLEYLQKFCGLNSAPINLVWEPVNHQQKLISIEGGLHIIGTTYFLRLHLITHYTVYLNPKFSGNKKTLIAALAHELSHIYASNNNITFKSPDTERGDMECNEQMTDLLGVALGMGELMCGDLDKDEEFNTSYLTNRMIYESYELWKSQYLSGQNKEIKTLIICSKCSQKLRAPISKKKLRLVCPKCKNAFEHHIL